MKKYSQMSLSALWWWFTSPWLRRKGGSVCWKSFYSCQIFLANSKAKITTGASFDSAPVFCETKMLNTKTQFYQYTGTNFSIMRPNFHGYVDPFSNLHGYVDPFSNLHGYAPRIELSTTSSRVVFLLSRHSPPFSPSLVHSSLNVFWHLHERVCLSVGSSMCWSVWPSVRWSVCTSSICPHVCPLFTHELNF